MGNHQNVIGLGGKSSPTNVIKDGHTITAPQKIANTLNVQILAKGSITIQKIPKITSGPYHQLF